MTQSLKEDGRPATLWFWDDWFSSFDVRACSLAARGLWMDMLGIMARSEIMGTLTINGKQIDGTTLARIVGISEAEIQGPLSELEDNRVFSRLPDSTIINRRMFNESQRKELISKIKSSAGKKGAEARWQTDGRPMAESQKDNMAEKMTDMAKTAATVILIKPERNQSKKAKQESRVKINKMAKPSVEISVGSPLENGEKTTVDIMAKMALPSSSSSSNQTNKTNNKKCPRSLADVDIRLVQLLINLMEKNNPNSLTLRNLTEKRQAEWVNQCRLLREADDRSPEQIEAVIRFSQADEFWQQNILSMPKLREKWDQLWLKANRGGVPFEMKEKEEDPKLVAEYEAWSKKYAKGFGCEDQLDIPAYKYISLDDYKAGKRGDEWKS